MITSRCYISYVEPLSVVGKISPGKTFSFKIVSSVVMTITKYWMWLWPLQSFECDYGHYSTVGFGNARTTSWRKNVLYL